MSIAIGKANYSGNGGGFEKTLFFKLGHKEPQQRTVIARIAPPVGVLAEKGIWSRFIKQHFGYTISVDTRNGKKNIPQTFLCLEDKDKNKVIVKHCPECDEIASQKAKLEAKTNEMKAAGKTKEDIDAATRFLRSWLKDHNLDKKWHMVAKNPAGQWGFLTVSHTCYGLLKGKKDAPGIIDGLVAKNVDPLSVDKGVWFRFTRNGGPDFNTITDIPTVEKEELPDGSERTKYDSLTQADIDAIEKLPSLNALGRSLTYDQIKMLVQSGGAEDTVRAVMNLPRDSQGVTPQGSVPNQTTAAPAVVEDDEPSSEETTSAPAAAPEAPTASQPAEEDEVAKLQRQLAEAQAKAAAAKTQAAAVQTQAGQVAKAAGTGPQPGGDVKKALELPMDQFLAKYENRK